MTRQMPPITRAKTKAAPNQAGRRVHNLDGDKNADSLMAATGAYHDGERMSRDEEPAEQRASYDALIHCHHQPELRQQGVAGPPVFNVRQEMNP
jgi:hypothetical protein